MLNIEYASFLKVNDLININYYGQPIKHNCIVLETIQDSYFIKGLVIYLNGSRRETIDLENNDGLYVTKLN